MKRIAKFASRPATKAGADHDPIDTYVGKRLRLKRTLAGLSQGRLGELNDLTFQQIQKYESGANRISAGRLYRLAHLLGVKVEWFYEEMPPALLTGNDQAAIKILPHEDNNILNRRETLDLVRAYYRVANTGQRRKFCDLLKSMGAKEQ